MSKEPKTGTEEAKQITPRKLNNLLKVCKQASKDTREINSSIGGKIADAVENENLNKDAFAMLRKLDKMSPEKLYDCWNAFEYYVDVSGIKDRAKVAPRLPIDDEDEDEEDSKPKKAAAAAKKTETKKGGAKPEPDKPDNVAAFPGAKAAQVAAE